MTRAAASSMASGSPSRRRQIAVTAAAFVFGQRKWGAAARSTKRRRPERWRSGRIGNRGEPRATPAEPRPLSRSSCRRSGSARWPGRDRRGRPPGHRPPIAPTSGRCSRLSSTSRCGERSAPAHDLVRRVLAGGQETQRRRDLRRDERGVGDRSEGNERDIPGERIGQRRAATASARLVLPTPPGPVSVSNRSCPACRSATMARTSSFTADERRTLTR